MEWAEKMAKSMPALLRVVWVHLRMESLDALQYGTPYVRKIFQFLDQCPGDEPFVSYTLRYGKQHINQGLKIF